MFTPSAPITIPPMVSVFTKGIGWIGEDTAVAGPTSNNASASVTYLPIFLPSSCVVKRVWWANGATTTGGSTIEVGIYADSGSSSPGTRLVYGSAVQGTASQVQFVDVADTALSPGPYWIAIVASSSGSTTFFQSTTSSALDAVFGLGQSTNTLPSSATPIETATNLYLCGFSTTSGTTDIPAPPSMFAPSAPITIPLMVSVFTKGIGWVGEDVAAAAPSSQAAISGASYFPILLPSSCVVKRVWWANGATTTGGATVECGIYSDSGSFSPSAKLVSGSATQGTASEVQFVDVTDTALAPGLYWIAIVVSATTNTTFFQGTINDQIDASRMQGQSSLTSLPSSATPGEWSAEIYLCGFSTTSSP